MKRSCMLAAGAMSALLGGCSDDAESLQYGPNPQLPQPERGLLPNMTIAEPASWGDQRPTVPSGYAISALSYRFTDRRCFCPMETSSWQKAEVATRPNSSQRM